MLHYEATILKKLNLFHSMEILFPEYFTTTENMCMVWNWTKLWKLDFPTFFYNVSKKFPYYGRGSILLVRILHIRVGLVQPGHEETIFFCSTRIGSQKTYPGILNIISCTLNQAHPALTVTETPATSCCALDWRSSRFC